MCIYMPMEILEMKIYTYVCISHTDKDPWDENLYVYACIHVDGNA